MPQANLKPPEPIATNGSEQEALLDECEQHESDSYTWMGTMRKDWDDKESMLLGYKPEDRASKTTKAKIYVPDLSTMIMEREARVLAQPPGGEAFAVSKNDVGKNMLMNMLMHFFQDHANEDGSHLLKLRQMGIYSHVYGSTFSLIPWRVNQLNGYVGPEMLPINMRDVRPQPGRRTIDKSDWFGVRSVASLEWLKNQDKDTWTNIDKVIAEYKSKRDSGEDGRTPSKDTRSYVERQRYPSRRGDEVFPTVELFTEYRHDKWITWAPRVVDNDKAHPWILRVVKNPYPKGYLPIAAKHAFPLLDSLIGLGDFERGKSLQFAKNSLVNLYMDGVKYAIFPPLHINLDSVDPASIKWGAGEKWYMDHPNVDVQVMELKTTEWLNTFQSTYGFLTTGIQNLSGSSSVSEVPGTEASLGKTPGAIKQYQQNESARDEWERFMAEEFIMDVYNRWMALITQKLDVPITMRVFGAEIKDLQKEFPEENILEVFQSGDRGNVSIDKNLLNDGEEIVKYDFELEHGSTLKQQDQDESVVATEILQDFIKAPQLLQEIRAEGKDIKFSELYKRKMIGGGMKDWDRILVDANTQGAMGQQQLGADGSQPGAVMPGQAQPHPMEMQNGQGQGQGQSQVTERLQINYKDAPEDVKRQMEQKAGFQASQMATPGQIIHDTATSQGMQPAGAAPDGTVPDPSQNGQFKDPAIAAVVSQVLGGGQGQQ